MKIQMIKMAGGVMAPASDMDSSKLTRFRTGEQYEIDIKLVRNPQFHRKVFAFLEFCFQHWAADRTDIQFMDEAAQFDTFREHLTVLAGYYEQTWTITGKLRVRAKSLSFGNMPQAEFEQFYNAVIRAALKHIFGGTTDQRIIDKLQSFF